MESACEVDSSSMRRSKNYATSFGFDFHACMHYKERVPVDENCDHIPCRKLFQASDCSTYIDPALPRNSTEIAELFDS